MGARRIDRQCSNPDRELTLRDIGGPEKWYHARWGSKSPTVSVYGYSVRLPEPPPITEMINYGMSEDDAYFRRTALPRSLAFWSKRKRDAYVRREWHRRRHGIWIIIKDTPIYLTGQFYTFLNYWHTAKGPLPQFRMGDWEFFTIWMDAVRDPGCLGILDFKARRLGDTEKALFLMWETVSKTRKSMGGMQNKTDTEAKGNFIRLVDSSVKVPDFFRPVHEGNDRPKSELAYRYPSKSNTDKSLRAGKDKQINTYYEEQSKGELNSVIDYRAATPLAYDGYRMAFYHPDEAGKWVNMDPNVVWDIVKYCLMEEGTKKVGMALFTTTVEDFESASTLENAKKLWKASDPAVLNSQGWTKTRLRRIFRSARIDAKVDKWGRHESDKYVQLLMELRAQLEKDGDLVGLTNLRRKKPLTVQDIFILDPSQCSLNPAIIDARMMGLERKRHRNGQPININYQNYKLNWKEGIFGGQVEAIVDPDGPWTLSQLPSRANAKRREGRFLIPDNKNEYAMGCDPIDHERPADGGSDFSIAIFRKWNPILDKELKVGSDGKPLKEDAWRMQSNQFIGYYRDRPDDPYEAYEESLKGSMFFGTSTLYENNKPGCGNWIKKLDHHIYSRYASGKTYNAKVFGSSGSSKSPGQAATRTMIQDYVATLLHYITKYSEAMYFEDMLQDMRKFNKKTRTECDLTVACGFTLVEAYDNLAEILEEQRTKWDTVPFATF